MEYRERPPPPHLAGLIKARWTLAAADSPGEWIEQQATPDGCVEIVRRLKGRSRWGAEQPECFVVGLITRPQPFEISGDSAFEAVRLWPWAWGLIGDMALGELTDCWCEWSAPGFATIEQRLCGAPDFNAIGAAIVAAPTVARMSDATGMGPRRLQRWFARHVGQSPREYLRLLRFQSAFASLPGQPSLAGHAAEHGFADQAHMAREMRRLAGVTARTARRRATGPFFMSE